MKKILKFISSLLLISLILSISFIYCRYTTTPTKIIPYPYNLIKSAFSGEQEALNSDILIIGDRMGKALDPFLESIKSNTAKGLESPLRIINWSRPNEGLHRTLAKLKGLKKLPKVIIYHGASEEFFEKKFLVKDIKKIKKNFELYKNEKVLTSIMTYPPLSKFIYSKMSDIRLNELTKNTSEYPPQLKQVQMEIGYILYKNELRELIEYIKNEESQLILLTTPLNLEAAPKDVCSNSLSTTVQIEQNDINKLLAANKTKEAYRRAKELNVTTPGNALSSYLLGKAALKIGRIKEAKAALNIATALDCGTWRSNAVFNSIIKRQAQLNDLHIIDFHEGLNRSLGKNILFMDDIYPQTLFYQALSKEIIKKIKIIFKLR